MNFISILKGRKQQFLPKNLLIIKICSLLLVCCNVMAFGADNHTRDPLVSVNMKNATLESVLNYIEETTSYSFLYNKQQVDVGQRIDISQKDQPISVILDILFKGSDITYSINGKQIVLSKSRSNAFSKVDKRLLTGTVIDSKGEAVIGANVIVKGEKSGKATDIEGNFSIEVPDKGVLLVSYIGFQPQEVSYGTKKNVTVVLQENNTSLDEVVVVGFGKQKKESVIGAYLTLMSYGMFVKEMPEMPGLKEYLKNRREKEWPGDRICDLTLLKLLSEEKTADEENLEMEEKILSSCVKEGMLFEFFRNLDQSILRPYQLDDKTFVEYHTSPETLVTLYYSLDTGLGTVPDYKSEPLKNVYEGIFARAFTLFYGETLRYYFQTEDETGVHKTEEKILTMSQSNDQASSKYQLINQILCARKLEKDTEVKEKLAQYLRQEQYVNEMFVIEKEPER